ncbi:nucleolin-like [Limulus polyphemus]|uniref:Nucleolin-like n=1 Tax=Limulus polyphemus TaxID=6850 RepID=A0ABM1B5K6_LIMPO|nr:nucleolin-like [Limulus polyphemus]
MKKTLIIMTKMKKMKMVEWEKQLKARNLQKVETPTKRKLEEKGETAIQKKKNRMETREVKVATPDSNKKGIKRKGQEDDIENTVVKKAKPLDDELRALTEKRIKERNSRTLFIRMLPEDVTVAEVKALSPDIVTCRIPIKKKRKNKNVFAFVEFNSEEKSEENFEKLKKKTVRGKQIFVDYTGEKSLTHKPSHQNWDVDKKVLFITNIDPSTTLEDLGEFYPRSSEIKFQKPAKDGHFREAYVKFETEEAAAEAFKKSDNLKMKGNILVVLFAHLKIQTNQSKTKKRKKFQKKQKSENQKEEEYESDSDE